MSDTQQPIMTSSYLAISLLGTMSDGEVQTILSSINNSGSNIESYRLVNMAGLVGMLILIRGNWGAIAKCEEALSRLTKQNDLSLHMQRTEHRIVCGRTLPYAIDLVAPDQPGILHHIVSFINQYEMRIRDIQSACCPISESDSRVFSARINVQVPETLSIAAFRNDFNDLCDQLNLDAIIELVK